MRRLALRAGWTKIKKTSARLALPAATALLCGCAALPAPLPRAGAPVAPPRQPALALPAWVGQAGVPNTGGNNLPASGASSEPEDPAARYTPLEPETPARWLFDFKADIGGHTYAFPCVAGRFAATGWQLQADAAQTLEPGEVADALFTGPAGTVKLRLAGHGSGPLPLLDCLAAGPVAGGETTAAVTLAGGVGIGAARADVAAACGEPEPGTSAGTMAYAAGRQATVTFELKAGRVAAFEMFCLDLPVQPPKASELPAEAAAWQAPEALGDDWRDFTVACGGRLYALPVPVAQLMWDGWLLRDEMQLAPGEWVRGVSLQKDGMVLRTMVYNYSSAPQPLAHCFATMLEQTKNGMNLPLALAGGLGWESTPDEVASAWGRPGVIDYENNAYSYVYKTDAGKVVFSFRNENSEMYDIEVWHYPQSMPSG